MIKNFFKLISSEFQLMLKGSVFSFVLYCLLIISCAIFALSLKHHSMGINAPLSFLYIMIFFISLFKVEKIYDQDFNEENLHQYLLSPFSLEIIFFVKNMIKWLYLLFCKVGIHRYEKIDINYSFGPGGSTETIKCKDCGIKKIRKKD